ncbi:MAG: type II toxin-antitoxin system RelE/ParE family toxin [Deltaproteobacteria bacterium]|nr:type II toxin-antitoxin system RelE/ParE family toxin [Deltaproteobacteria bacterium]
MAKILFHPDVYQEIEASWSWYQNKADGLGDDFLRELESAYQLIQQLPTTWPLFQKGFRRYLLLRFPYSVIYRERGGELLVVAIMHNSRKTGYWLQRA